MLKKEVLCFELFILHQEFSAVFSDDIEVKLHRVIEQLLYQCLILMVAFGFEKYVKNCFGKDTHCICICSSVASMFSYPLFKRILLGLTVELYELIGRNLDMCLV